MAVNVTLAQILTVVESWATTDTGAAAINSANDAVTYDGFNKTVAMDAGTSVPATTVYPDTVALAAGAKTLDLTSLTGLHGAIDMSDLKVQAVFFENPSTNANSISMAAGASNGSEVFGSDFKVTCEPGQSVLLYGAEEGEDVDATHKTFDFAGTLVQPFNIVIVAG